MRSLLVSLISVLLISSNLAAPANAKAEHDGRWKEMRKISAMVTARLSEAKERQIDPKGMSITTVTTLSFLDLAIAAYYRPASPAKAARIAKTDDSVFLLARALSEWNRDPDPEHACLTLACASRQVSCPIVEAGLDIYTAPVRTKSRGYGRVIAANQ
jgi:hypothetical protein